MSLIRDYIPLLSYLAWHNSVRRPICSFCFFAFFARRVHFQSEMRQSQQTSQPQHPEPNLNLDSQALNSSAFPHNRLERMPTFYQNLFLGPWITKTIERLRCCAFPHNRLQCMPTFLPETLHATMDRERHTQWLNVANLLWLIQQCMRDLAINRWPFYACHLFCLVSLIVLNRFVEFCEILQRLLMHSFAEICWTVLLSCVETCEVYVD